MYKTYTSQSGICMRLYHKIALIMRLTTLILLICLMQVSAATYGQRITIKRQNASLVSVLKEIRGQSGYDFFFDDNTIPESKKVSISVSDATLDQALQSALAGMGLEYKIEGKIISIRKETTPVWKTIGPNAVIDVRGRILDENGEPLANAIIRVKGTTRQAQTDGNGEFVLTGTDEGAIIVVSFIGYTSKEIKASAAMGEIVLSVDPQELKVVEVKYSTGYQTISKERSTGSFGTVSKDQLDKPSTDISQRLIGTIAGLQARGMDENGNPTFEIRGQTSLLANASPLLVVDGFPVQGDFRSINPNDVETVTVLKDAAAASIWGARAANGVIVVTTKKTRGNAPLKVELNAFTRIGAKMDLDYVRPLASSAETVEYEKLAYANWRTLPDPVSIYDAGFAFSSAQTALNEFSLGEITAAERDARLKALSGQDNKDQISDLLLANPVSTQVNLSLSGGTKNLRNYLSLMYEDNQSNFKGTDGNRYMLNFRSNADLAKWLKLDLNGMYLFSKNNNNGVTLEEINTWSPYDMLKNPDGSLTNVHQYYTPLLERFVPMDKFPYADWTYNPIQEIANRSRTTEQSLARLQAAFTFRILRGLSAELRGQYEMGNLNSRDLANENTFQVRSAVNTATSWDQVANTFTPNLPKGGILNLGRTKTESYNVRGQLNFDRRFGEKHEVNALGGIEFRSLTAQSITNPTAYGYNEQTMGVGIFPNGPGGPSAPIVDWMGYNQTFGYTNVFGYSTQRLFSAFGNAAYTYNGKYTVSGSYRFDASNLITDDPAYRYAPFYSAGVAWQAGREDFLQSATWIDQLTARLTYGHLGNYDPTTSFRPLITPGASPNIFINAYTAGFSSYGNPTLRWERTKVWTLGFDFSFFNNGLFGKVDLYNKNGQDLLAVLSIPSIHGTGTQRLNNAAMTNKGIELELGTIRNLTKDLTWRGNVNFSYNRNRITDLFVINYNAYQMSWGGSAAYVEGYDANTIWRREYAGVEDKQPVFYGPGKQKYTLTSFIQTDPRSYMQDKGTLVAPYTLGFMNAFQYKRLALSFIVTGKFGHQFQRMGFNYPATWVGRVLPNSKLTEVMQGDPSKIIPLPLNEVEPEYYSWESAAGGMGYLIESASHVRLQEVNLNYTLAPGITRRMGMSRLMVYAQGNNLFIIRANKAGEDPEYVRGTMRPMPTYTFGFKCEF